MSGIRINAAAEMLGVSASTLRSWERRLGYPNPHRTPGNHRLYLLDEVEALREALRETHNISSAVEVARLRGRGPASPARLVATFEPLRRGRGRSRARGEPRGPLGRAHRLRGAAAGARAGGGSARTAKPSSSTHAAGRPAGCIAPGDSPPARPRRGRAAARLRLAAGRRVGPGPGARALPAPGRAAGAAALHRPRRGPLPQRPARLCSRARS